MSKSDKTISKIMHGELNMYYPFKVISGLNFPDLCKEIKNSKICFNKNYRDLVYEKMYFQVDKIESEIKEKFKAENVDMTYNIKTVGGQAPRKIKRRKQSALSYEANKENMRFELNSMETRVVSTEIEALDKRVMYMQSEIDFANKYYGASFTGVQKRFVLLPFKASLASGQEIWIHVVLVMFENMMGVLKIEIPLREVDVSTFKKCDYDSLVSSIKSYWGIQGEQQDLKLSILFRYYLSHLFTNKKMNIGYYGNSIMHAVFTNLEGIPKQLSNIPSEIKEELYRIVHAPVPDYPNDSYENEAIALFEESSIGEHGIKHLINTKGAVFSIVDKNYVDFYREQCEEKFDNVTSEEIHNGLAKSISENFEFSLLTVLLKRTNECANLYEKTNKKGDLIKIRRENSINSIFINELQNNCYGSVIEQTSALESMLILYFRKDVTDKNKEALDCILEDKSQQDKERMANILSVGSFLFTLIFGLQPIYEAICIFRRAALFFGKGDIPFFTKENASVVIWGMLNVVFFMFIMRGRLKSKRAY